MLTTTQRPGLIRLMIVDDHPSVRFGLSALFRVEEDIEVCGEAKNTLEALSQFRKVQPDVVLVDISLGGENGLLLIEHLKSEDPRARCLVISLHDEMLYAERAIHAGALGYVSKSEALEELVKAVRQVAAGRIRLSAKVADHIFRKLADSGFARSAGSPVSSLTDRELQVFELVGRGLGSREIADRLNLSAKTVSTYFENIKHKLDLPSKTAIVRHAVAWLKESE